MNSQISKIGIITDLFFNADVLLTEVSNNNKYRVKFEIK